MLVPGSHAIISQNGSGKPLDFLPPAINCTCPAGTGLIFDARCLHGTGVNTTDEPRYVLNAGFLRPWLRSQDNAVLTLSSEVLQRASPKVLHRLGFQAHGALGTVDGHGFGASPKTGDPNAEIRVYREALDAGAHKPIGRLSPDMSETELGQDFTFRLTASAQGREWKGLEGLPLKKTG